MSVRDVIFIDANQYLGLYATPSGKILLAAVLEQRDHILVTEQIVEEVNRNKVKVTERFLAEGLKKLELNSIAVPVHLLSKTDARVEPMGEQLEMARRKVKEAKEEFEKLTQDVLKQVSQSRDEMSAGLAELFVRDVRPEKDELQRARDRRERGYPPGKQDDPLGDQITWEQILSECRKDKPRLWIITSDPDYCTGYAGEMFLNASLYQDLSSLYKSEPPVFCFNNITECLRDFDKTTGAKAKNLPTPEEAEQIKKEQESLSTLGWLAGYDDSFSLAIPSVYRMRDSMMLAAALAQLSADEAIPPPATKKADKGGT